jgi:mono/diheme cytochrome c family protein
VAVFDFRVCGLTVTPLGRTLAIALSIACVSSFVACAEPESTRDQEAAPPDESLEASMCAYVKSFEVGRRALERSVVNPSNGYSMLRLSRYDENRWGALPELHAKTAPMIVDTRGRVGAPKTRQDEGLIEAPSVDDAAWETTDTSDEPCSLASLRAVGEKAFVSYPAQVSSMLPSALTDPDHAGVWTHDGRFGAVWVSFSGGPVTAAITCATCHASNVGERWVPGRNNPEFDVVRVFGGAGAVASNATEADPSIAHGLVDVTPDGVPNPVAISDLRPIRYQSHLHHTGTLRNDPVALAVRIETLLITSHHESVRPSRRIAAALAVYLWSLAPPPRLPDDQEPQGALVFQRECVGCHAGVGAGGGLVKLESIGTDPAVGQSSDRGTGFYRVPSLRSVGDRQRLFAGGAVENLETLLTPGRAAPGHAFGLALSPEERKRLLRYLSLL